MNTQWLQYFIAAAELGSITEAAKKLYKSRTSIATGIAALEDELGHRLFLRTKDGLQLTEYGQRIRSEAAEILKVLDSWKSTPARKGLPVDLFFLPALLEVFSADLISSLIRDFPEVGFYVKPAINNIANLAELAMPRKGRCSLVLGGWYDSEKEKFYDLLLKSGLRGQPLFATGNYMYHNQNAKLFSKKSVTLQDLANSEFKIVTFHNGMHSMTFDWRQFADKLVVMESLPHALNLVAMNPETVVVLPKFLYHANPDYSAKLSVCPVMGMQNIHYCLIYAESLERDALLSRLLARICAFFHSVQQALHLDNLNA